MADEIEEIKRRINIVDLISSYLTLKKAGSNYKALCPFHQEKTPSFMVSSEKQIFKCFGCGKSGSIFDFLMEMENLEFPEALRILAERAGVQLKTFERKEYKIEKDQKTKVYEINRLSARFFHKILIGKPKAEFVRDYLAQRKISDKSIKEFMLGFAPDSYDLLSNFLVSRGYGKLDIHQSGFSIASEKKEGEYYDRFRDRLMFPISDALGNIVGFSGRAMHKTEAGKYINSPDTPIFLKSRVLYGLDKAKQVIKEKKRVIVVEGQMDVISVHQAGFLNVVASSGTALTKAHLEILGRFTKNLSFCFDQDEAGEEATKRAIDLAHQEGFDVKIILLPSGNDPDDCLRENRVLWEECLKEQKGAIDYYFENIFAKKKGPLEAADKREIAKELLATIKNLSDKIAQSHYIKKLAEKLETPERFLYEALDKIDKKQSERNQAPALPAKSMIENFEDRLIGLILSKPEFQADFFKRVDLENLENPRNKEIAEKLKIYYNKVAVFNLNSFKKKFPDIAMQIDLLVLQYEKITDQELLKAEYEEYVRRITTSKTEKIKKLYEEKIKEAEKSEDKDRVKKLIKDFQKAIIGK
ncbi:MAG: DNA primase [Candidatus Berkelbacteria bacterium]|nr:DNA primase [Candidatus Berkelbacteria bacterium]